MRRLALPLALSLFAHGLLLTLLGLFVGNSVGERNTGDGFDGPAIRLSIAGWERRAERKTPASLEPEWDVDAEPPRIVPTQATGEVATPPIVPASLFRPAKEPILGGSGAGTGTGFTPSSAGSMALPLPPRTQKIVYLLDRSASMSQHRALGRAIAELKLSLASLPPGTWFQVLVYNRVAQPLSSADTGLIPATPERIALVQGAMDDLVPSGATDHVAAFRRALALRPEVLYLLTDDDDLSEADVLAIRQANRGGTMIHVVEFNHDESPMMGPLARLAAAFGGTHRRVRP